MERAVDGSTHLTGFRHNHYDLRNEASCFGDFSDDYDRPEGLEASAQAALRRVSRSNCGWPTASRAANSVDPEARIRAWYFPLSCSSRLSPAFRRRLFRE